MASQPQTVTDPGDTDAITEAIIAEVAAEKSAELIELKPLYSVIDTDALQTLFRREANGRVVFYYEGCDVEVAVDGTVTVDASRQAE